MACLETIITVMSHECHGISNNWQIDWFLYFVYANIKDIFKVSMPHPLCMGSNGMVTGGFHSQQPINEESFPWHSMSHEICLQLCCVLFCCDYTMSICGCMIPFPLFQGLSAGTVKYSWRKGVNWTVIKLQQTSMKHGSCTYLLGCTSSMKNSNF